MEHTIVRTRDVKRVYRMGDTEVHALRGVNLEIYAGEYISIMGPSGSGKTTLFNMIGGLDKPTEGKVYIDEVDVAQLDAYELAWLRCRKIGYIFQTFNIGLGDRLNHKPFELSGGQQQRVAIARAMANDPAVILADEPTGNLDLNTGTEIIELLQEMNKTSKVTIITATHDMKMLSASDRIVWIRDGRVDRIEKRSDLDIEEGGIAGVTD